MADQTVSIDFIAQYKSNMAQMDRDLNRMASSARKVGGEANKSLHQLARVSKFAGTALMVGVGAALAVGIKASIEFESSFAGVRKTVEASEPEFQALAMTIRELSKEIPVTVHELNRIAELGGQLGVPVEALDEFTEVIALLGATTNLEIDDAATGFARIANVMGTSLSDFDNMGSAIVDLGNNFATTEEEILNFALRLSGIASTVGISEEDVLGLATAFTSLGEPAERGATALQRTFVAFQNLASAGGPQLRTLADLMGLTAEATKALIKSDPTEAFLLFEAGLGDLIDSGGDAAGTLKDLGLGAVRTTTLLLKGAAGVDVLTSAVDTSNDAWSENVALQEEAEKRFETVQSQITLMFNAFTDLRIEIGDKLLPAVRDIVRFMHGFFGVLQDNMGFLTAFAAGIALLAGARFLGFLTAKLGAAALNLRNFSSAMSAAILTSGGLKQAFNVMRVGMGGLSSILTIVAIGFGAVATAMASSRAKTREFEASIENLREVLGRLADEGASVATTNELIESTLASLIKSTAGELFQAFDEEEIRRVLVATGTSINEFVDGILGSGDDLEKWAIRVRTEIFGVAPELADQPIFRSLGGPAMATAINDFENLLRRAHAVRMQLREEQRLALSEAALQGPSISQTALAHEFDSVARELQERLRAALTPEEGLFSSIEFALGEEDGEEIFNKILESTSDFGDAFNDNWTDIVDGLQDTFGGWTDAWQEYEQVAVASVDKMTASLKAWNEDQQRLLTANQHVVDNFSIAQQQTWFQLPEGMRRQFAASLDKQGPGAFEALLSQAFGQVGVATGQVFLAEMQQAPSEAFAWIQNNWPARLQAALDGLPDESKLIFGNIAAAGNLALRDALTDVDPLVADAITMQLTALAEEFQSKNNLIHPENWMELTTTEQIQWLVDQGMDLALAIALGFSNVDLQFIFAEKLSAAAAASIRAAKGQYELTSPSKVFEKIGIGVGEGFTMGLGDAMAEANEVFKDFQVKAQIAATPAPISVDMPANMKSGDTNISVVGHTKDLDASTRLAGTLLGVSRRVETKVGKR